MIEDKVIRFRDVFWYIISKWKVVIIVVLIGAIIGGAYSFLKADKSISVDSLEINKDTTVEELLASVEDLPFDEGTRLLQATLTQADLNNMQIYYDYIDMYNLQSTYVNSLDLTKMDPHESYYSQYLFYISSDSSADINAITKMYVTRLNDLREKYGTLFSYTSEVYSSVPESGLNASTIQYSKPSSVLVVGLYGAPKDACLSEMDTITDFVYGLHDEVCKALSDHDISKIAESCYKVTNTAVLDMQKSNTDYLSTLNNGINNQYKVFSVGGQAFVRYVANNSDLNGLEVLETNSQETSEDKSVKETDKRNRISFKMVGAGAIVGLIAIIIILAIVYCASNKVKFEDNIELLYKVPCLGKTKYGRNSGLSLIDKRIESARYKKIHVIPENITPEIVSANIYTVAKNKKKDVIYATGTVFDERSRQLAEAIKAILITKGINLVVGKGALLIPEEIEKMGDIGCVVLFEDMCCSYQNSMAMLIQTCSDRGVDVLGLVVLG